jgi:vitamin B12 transporter
MRAKIIIILFFVMMKLIGLNITGRVVDVDEEPIGNVIITVNNKAVISRENGNFRLVDVSAEDEINFHKISYKDREIIAGNIKETIVLEDDIITIEGLRVIEERKKELIGLSEIIVIKTNNNSGSAADILRDNSDLQISGIPLTGEEQKIIFPGYKARHTLVMLDGIPLNKSGTAFDISTIPAEIIESIEVMKGSSSSIGGAGSMGGIININTKMANNKYMVNIGHSFGSFGLDKHSLIFSAANSKFQFYTFVRKSFARNDFEYIPAENPDTLRTRDFNDKSIYDANISLGYSGSIGMLSYKLLFQDFFKKLPGNVESLEYFKDSRLTGQSQKHILNYSRKLEDYRIKADIFYSLDKSLYDNTRLDSTWSENIYLATLARNRQLSRGIKLHSEYLSDTFYIDWGGDYRYEDFKYTDLNFPDQSIEKVYRNNYAVFGKTQLQQKHFPYTTSLTGSARWDNTTGFNDHTSWKVEPEFSYENYFKIFLGGNVANGYTLPSYYSLFWKGDTHVSGNPDLKPESSLSWQIFSKLELLDNSFKVTYRHDDIDDMIIWIRDEWEKWKPMNLSVAEIENWDFELNLNPYKYLKLGAIYTRSSAINRSKNDPNYGSNLIYAPDYSLNINVRFESRKFMGNLIYKFIGEQWSNSDQSAIEHLLPAYDLIDAGVEYSVSWKNFKFTPEIRVNNVFNKLYEIYDHVPQPGFNWEVNLGIEFKK